MSDGAMFTLAQAAAWVPGARLVGDGTTPVARVHTDTRTLAAGDLFVALRGERFDANDFLADAKARGAVAAVAHHGLAQAGLPGLEVPDSLAALGAIAHGWRAQFELPLIAVTGSNGKTTVTQMIASVLRTAAGERSLATAGNFNNEVGVPLTLLRLRAQHSLAVVELGMNRPGEIARLAAMAQPTIALVNNAQREHQEFMATVEAVARENGSVFVALPENGTAVFPHGDAYATLWEELAREGGPRRCISFGSSPDADVALASAEWQGDAWQFEARTPIGNVQARLRIAGRHNVHNALAVVACAMAAGVSLDEIGRGLSAFEPVRGRSRSQQFARTGMASLTLVDDTYNANPDSVRAAIDVLAELPAPRLLVLGDMGEVGDQGPRFHAEVGDWARIRGLDALYALGDATPHAVDVFNAGSPSSEGRHFDSIEALNAAVLARLPTTASLVVKGSRFMKMERVVQSVTAQLAPPPQEQKEAGHAA